MELMPHVKALLDDLVSLTKTMIVKRTDLAMAYEGSINNTDLYYKYKKVIDGEMTYSALVKSEVPYNVLSSIYRWENLSDPMYYDLTAENHQYSFENKKITIRNYSDLNKDGVEEAYLTKLGDIYIRQQGTLSSNYYVNTKVGGESVNQRVYGKFAKLYKGFNRYSYTNISLYKPLNSEEAAYGVAEGSIYEDTANSGIYKDSNTHEIVNTKYDASVIIDDDNRVLFVNKDNEDVNLYVINNELTPDGIESRGYFEPVAFKRDTEFISKEDADIELGNMIIGLAKNKPIGSSYNENDIEGIVGLLAASSNDYDYIYFGGYANPEYISSQQFVYESESAMENGEEKFQFIKYVYDNDFGRYRLYEEGRDDNLTIYYRRFYNEYYTTNALNNITYAVKDTEVPYYYEKVNDIDYYDAVVPAVDDNDEQIVDENGMRVPTNSGIYLPKENFGDEFDENWTAYTKYINNKSGLISFNEEFTDSNGDVRRKYDKTIYVSTDGGLTQEEIIVYVDKEIDTIDYYEHYVETPNGSYIKVDDKYIHPDYDNMTDDELYNTTFYEKEVLVTPFIYKRTTQEPYVYTRIDEFLDTEDMYTYLNDNISVYQCVRAFTDDDIQKFWNNTLDINEQYEDIIANKYCTYILDQYAPRRNTPGISVTICDGEQNAYYRQLNGLPPRTQLDNQPKIDRNKIFGVQDGDDPNPYLYNLRDDEVEYIQSNGTLDKIKSIYPTAGYLKYLGKNRIDIVKAREAAPFDILVYGPYKNKEYLDMFNNAYSISKNYVIHNYYNPEMFDVNEYYGAYIGMLILVHTLNICMAQSSDILVHNRYSDYDTVQLKLKSFGFENTFDNIPLIYRKNIAKNLELLIKNKGIDAIYDIIYKTFNIDDVEVYKYYFRRLAETDGEGNFIYDSDENLKYKLSMAQVPISSDNVLRDIINPDNEVNYDLITNSDKYWGVYETKESLKESFENFNFNYMNSKYITLNNKFNLSTLNFSSSYYLNYVYELLDNNSLFIDIEGFDKPLDLKYLFVTLFAIQSIKYGFMGNIPNDLVSTAAVLKFNLNEEVTVTADTISDNEDIATKSKLVQIIDRYYDHMTNKMILSDSEKQLLTKDDKLTTISDTERYWRGKGKAKSIRNAITKSPVTKPPIVLPTLSNGASILDVISESYLNNLATDDKLTTANDEGSLYNTILRYKDEAKTYNDYVCFDNLAKLISISKVLKEYYSIDPVWEEIAEVQARPKKNNKESDNYYMKYAFEKQYYYDESIEDYVEPTEHDKPIWRYYNIENMWTRIDPNTDKEFLNIITPILENGKIKADELNTDSVIYFCNDNPLLSKAYDFTADDNDNIGKYMYAIRIGNNKRSEILNHVLVNNNKFDLVGTLTEPIVVYKASCIFPLDVYAMDGSNTPDVDCYVREIDKHTATNGKVFMTEGNEVIYSSKDPVLYTGELSDGMYYFRPIANEDDQTCTIKIYRYASNAYTYEMYLKYKENDLYRYLQQRDGEDKTTYITRLNELYSIIIASIEDTITNNAIKEKLNLSLIDFSNIAKYIKIVLEVFKSYTVDLSSIDAIYTIDDKSQNRIKTVDQLTVHENSFMSSNMHSHSMISFEEQFDIPDSVGLRDEVLFEWIKMPDKGGE